MHRFHVSFACYDYDIERTFVKTTIILAHDSEQAIKMARSEMFGSCTNLFAEICDNDNSVMAIDIDDPDLRENLAQGKV